MFLRQTKLFFHFRPENVKRLYDLVQVKDADVKIAFYHALKDTLVADNLDQATRIAYPKVMRIYISILGICDSCCLMSSLLHLVWDFDVSYRYITSTRRSKTQQCIE